MFYSIESLVNNAWGGGGGYIIHRDTLFTVTPGPPRAADLARGQGDARTVHAHDAHALSY